MTFVNFYCASLTWGSAARTVDGGERNPHLHDSFENNWPWLVPVFCTWTSEFLPQSLSLAFAVLIYLHVDFSFRVIRITFFDLVTFLVNLWNPCSKKVGEIDGLSLLVAVDAWLAQYRSRMRSNAQTLVEISFRKYCFGNWDFTAAQVVWHQEEDGRRQFAYVGHETAAVEEIFILDHCRVPLQLANKVFSSFVARKKVWMQSALFGIYFIIWAVRRTEWLSKSVLIMATLAQT